MKRLFGPGTPGLHRLQWDLRQSAASSGATSSESRSGRSGGRRSADPLVEPGTYTVALTKIVDGKETVLGETQNLRVKPLL